VEVFIVLCVRGEIEKLWWFSYRLVVWDLILSVGSVFLSITIFKTFFELLELCR